ncbi:hypothetical protein SO802_015635 [Lithocarpus litseifolius]|uniref:Uncharacterized protein n=1 Tax=Lithocarpus litseifolius TaxID=425828 RepID=A0AAW2CWL9_9ROSI
MKNKPLKSFCSWRLRFVSKLRRTLLLRNRFAPAIYVAVVEVWCEGREEAEEWCEPAICVAVVEVRREGREEAGVAMVQVRREPASMRADYGGSA